MIRTARPRLSRLLVYASGIIALIGACIPLPPPGPAPSPTAAPTAQPVPAVEVRPFTAGKALLRISGVEGLRFGAGAGQLDNITVGTLMLAQGLTEGPAAELSLRGVEDAACERRPCGGKAGWVLRYSPWIAEDNRRYKADKMRPESDYLGEGVRYSNRVPLGKALADGSFLVEISWGPEGVRVDGVLLAGKCPGAAEFGWWTPGGASIGWAGPAFDAVKRGAKVELISWSGVPGERTACP